MKKLRIVQIGAEHDHSAPIMESLKRLDDVFELVGYAVPEGECVLVPESYEGVPRLTAEEALSVPDLDAAIIETSEINLTKYAIAAAERGLAIHMDKPGGVELADFEKLIATVKANQTVFHLGYMYRYNPAVRKLMQDIQEGKLGEIYSVETHMNCFHTPEKRQWLGTYKGGQLFFLGCHLIDLIYRIQGEPDEVIPLSCPTGVDGVTAEDFGMAVLKYPHGVSFAKSCALEPAGFMRRQLVVCGSKGTVQLLPFEVTDNQNQYTGVREVFEQQGNWGYDGVRYNSELHNRYDPMMRSFAAYIRGEKNNPYTYDYELGLYRLVLRCCGVI